MGRRGESIYHRKDGRWEARFCTGKDNTGKSQYRSVYAASYAEVKEKRRDALRQTNSRRKDILFSDVAAQWLDEKATEVKIQTIQKYRQILEKHILPYFSGTRCSAITPITVDFYLKEKQQCGLSRSMLRIIGVVLQAVLAYAYRNGMGMAAMIPVKKPKAIRSPVCLLKAHEQQRLEALLLQEPHGANLAVYLALHTGMRLGEICTLEWGNVDFVERQIYVRTTAVRERQGKFGIGTPKSKASLRTIPITDALLLLLQRERMRASSAFVFPSPKNDSFFNPRTLQCHFRALLRKQGLQQIKFHALRHTFATRWIECGCDVKSLSELLGHTSIQITMDIYVHSSDRIKLEAMERMERVFGQLSCQEQAKCNN
ncbi:MAG: tyrosine-type recombinase/integrase [Oscillospiraceae bacterium]|nr:tyrosine-type recombinase/integrase [Oscillospiraceae bacterium]